MSHKIQNLLGKVLRNISNSNGIDKTLLNEICDQDELNQINKLSIFKDKLYIYVKTNAALYEFSLRKKEIEDCVKNKSDLNFKDIVFKIGEIHGS